MTEVRDLVAVERRAPVQGSGSALMRAITGRAVGPEELSGPGAAALHGRLPRAAA